MFVSGWKWQSEIKDEIENDVQNRRNNHRKSILKYDGLHGFLEYYGFVGIDRFPDVTH